MTDGQSTAAMPKFGRQNAAFHLFACRLSPGVLEISLMRRGVIFRLVKPTDADFLGTKDAHFYTDLW
jgi:hypothetical protein